MSTDHHRASDVNPHLATSRQRIVNRRNRNDNYRRQLCRCCLDSQLINKPREREKQLTVEISQDLLERVDGAVGAYEREENRSIAVATIRRWRANKYIIDEDVITEASNRSELIDKTYSRIVRDTTKELEKLGLLTDGPEMKKAEAQQGWMDAISDMTASASNQDEDE